MIYRDEQRATISGYSRSQSAIHQTTPGYKHWVHCQHSSVILLPVKFTVEKDINQGSTITPKFFTTRLEMLVKDVD